MLTPKQEEFARAIALQGMNYSDAYRSAYSVKTMSDKTINDTASKLKDHPDIAQRVAELRGQLAAPGIMSAKERLEYLTGVINNTQLETRFVVVSGTVKKVETPADLAAKLKAIDIMNKMQGEYVQKVEAEVKKEITINIELVDDE